MPFLWKTKRWDSNKPSQINTQALFVRCVFFRFNTNNICSLVVKLKCVIFSRLQHNNISVQLNTTNRRTQTSNDIGYIQTWIPTQKLFILCVEKYDFPTMSFRIVFLFFEIVFCFHLIQLTFLDFFCGSLSFYFKILFSCYLSFLWCIFLLSVILYLFWETYDQVFGKGIFIWFYLNSILKQLALTLTFSRSKICKKK